MDDDEAAQKTFVAMWPAAQAAAQALDFGPMFDLLQRVGHDRMARWLVRIAAQQMTLVHENEGRR